MVRLGTEPNGLNINAGCGSNEPGTAARDRACARGPISAIALDGDADRLVLVDDRGNLIDGDQLLGLIAASWHADRRLRGDGVVATVMSNLGPGDAISAGCGLALHRTKVGDRYVVERMRADGCNVGGEQSGHIVLSDFATTGDGLLAALQVLAVLRQRDRPASEVARVFEPVPQRLRNVKVRSAHRPGRARGRRPAGREEARLDGTGRLLVRASGTEPVIRVMVEAEDEALLAEILETVSQELVAIAARAA